MTELVALTLALLVGALAGFGGGLYAVRRDLGGYLFDLRRAGHVTSAATGRANAAAAQIEAADLPAVLERLENTDSRSRQAMLTAKDAGARSIETLERQDELERAVASTFSINIRGQR